MQRKGGLTRVRVPQLSTLIELVGKFVIVKGVVGWGVRHGGWEKRGSRGIVEGRGRVITNILP